MNELTPFEEAERYFDQGDFKKSIQYYSLAIEKDPGNAHFISKRGVAFFRIGRNDEAIYDLDMALKMEPDNPYRYSSRAFVLSNLNRIDEAVKDYEMAVKLDPEDSIAYNNLGLLLEKKGYKEAASSHFNKADSLEGIKKKTIENKSPLPLITPKSNSVDYKSLNFWQFTAKVFTDKKLRSDFFRFIKNGFK
jgi:tetratricopeptide (TPR) repeat protein